MAFLFSSLYFILPAYFANMGPVFAAKLRLPFAMPISTRLFGSHKTYRGIYSGYLGALFILFLQKYLQQSGVFEEYRILDYIAINIYFYAFLFGVGAIMGDTVKSFFKRRKKIKEGSVWFPFDQLDFVVGAMVLIYPFYRVDWFIIITVLLITPLLHFLTNVTGYFLGIKKVWW